MLHFYMSVPDALLHDLPKSESENGKSVHVPSAVLVRTAPNYGVSLKTVYFLSQISAECSFRACV